MKYIVNILISTLLITYGSIMYANCASCEDQYKSSIAACYKNFADNDSSDHSSLNKCTHQAREAKKACDKPCAICYENCENEASKSLTKCSNDYPVHTSSEFKDCLAPAKRAFTNCRKDCSS